MTDEETKWKNCSLIKMQIKQGFIFRIQNLKASKLHQFSYRAYDIFTIYYCTSN